MHTRAALLALAATALIAACAGNTPASQGATEGGTTATPAGPASTPPTTPAPDAIQHATGAGDVILRVSLLGGFVRMEYLMGRVPTFTLYGDGRVLLVPDDNTGGGGTGAGGLNPGVKAGAPIAGTPLAEAHLDEGAVQQILRYAITQGGLGTARQSYQGTIMDLPSTLFEIHTGDVDRAVSVGALTADPEPGPDAAAYRAFASLLAKLRAIGTAGTYEPKAYIAVLSETEADPAAPASAWPWPELEPSAFAQPLDTDPVPFPKHILTRAQVDAVGVEIGPGGASGLRFDGPDGKTYVVAIRPALPEETDAI